MARVDKLLATIHAKGARALHLEPGQQPALELASGAHHPLLPDPTPPQMVEILAMEILPNEAREEFLRAGEIRFSYGSGGLAYFVTLSRDAAGIHLLAEPGEPIPALPGSLPGPAAGLAEIPPPAPPPGLPVPGAPAPAQPAPAQPAPAAPVSPAQEAPAPPSAPPASPRIDLDGLPLADRLFAALLRHRGSDLHCSSYEVPIARIDGDLVELEEFDMLGPNQMLDLMRSFATEAAWRTYESTHDADFAHAFEAGNCRFRVNFFLDRVGPGFVCRQIPSEIPDPDRLGLADPIRRLALLSKGLVLVTGPTGSGKSTTLAAILDLANQQREEHILTIEDPIEFVHPRKRCLVNQREVGTHTESFKKALRAALREDPDIVLVGEMRDLETIAIALETAITGHLVFGTLHTSSAIGTIDRIVDQFPSDRQQQIRVMLADCLKAVISQTLLKRKRGGRIAAIESLFITPAIANLIREGKNFQIPSAMQTGRAYGQRLMNDALVELILTDQVEAMECYMKCPDKESFMQAVKRASITFDPRGQGETAY